MEDIENHTYERQSNNNSGTRHLRSFKNNQNIGGEAMENMGLPLIRRNSISDPCRMYDRILGVSTCLMKRSFSKRRLSIPTSLSSFLHNLHINRTEEKGREKGVQDSLSIYSHRLQLLKIFLDFKYQSKWLISNKSIKSKQIKKFSYCSWLCPRQQSEKEILNSKKRRKSIAEPERFSKYSSLLDEIKYSFMKLRNQSTGVGRIFQRSRSFDISENRDHINDVTRSEYYPYNKRNIFPSFYQRNDDIIVTGNHTVACEDNYESNGEVLLLIQKYQDQNSEKLIDLRIRKTVEEGRERREGRERSEGKKVNEEREETREGRREGTIEENDKKKISNIITSSKKSSDRSTHRKDNLTTDAIESNLMPFQSNRYLRCKPSSDERESIISCLEENYDQNNNDNENKNRNENYNENENENENENKNENYNENENENKNDNDNENKNENENYNENENENENLKEYEVIKEDIWREYYSQNGEIYFYSLLSGESNWDPPEKENSQIEYQYQDKEGCPYWYNSCTGQSKWS